MPDDETTPSAPRDPRQPKEQEVNYGNSHKQREQQAGQTPDKQIKQVVKTPAVVRKESSGQKMKRFVTLLDFGAVGRWIYKEILLPNAKDTLWSVVKDGSQRMIYRNEVITRRNVGPTPSGRITNYQTPPSISRSHQNPYPSDPRMTRAIDARSQDTRRGPSRNNYIVSTMDEAEAVRDHLYNNLETYEQVSVGDLHQMLGLSTEYTDFKWGWYELGRVHIRQIPEGYLIELPYPEHL